jgi:hypothetical protein
MLGSRATLLVAYAKRREQRRVQGQESSKSSVRSKGRVMRTNVLPQVETRARALLVCGLLVCGLVPSAIFIGVDSAHANRASADRQSVGEPNAKASKIEIVNETLYFEITQIKGDVIYAQGKSSGTLTGNASLRLTLVNASHAVAELYAYNPRGSIKGSGHARYHASGAISHFSGSQPPSLSGSGKYKGLRALSMNLTGVMNRRTLKIIVQLKGKWDV